MYDEHVHDFNFPRDMLQRAAHLIANDTEKIDPEQARVMFHDHGLREHIYRDRALAAGNHGRRCRDSLLLLVGK